MGLLDKLFGGSSVPKEEKVLPWIPLQHEQQIHSIKERSKDKTQIIFKHSTRCGISRMVINQFVKQYTLTEDQADLYYLDILNFRDLSNVVASEFQVWHESPQLLVIKNGETLVHASHSAINVIDLDVLIN